MSPLSFILLTLIPTLCLAEEAKLNLNDERAVFDVLDTAQYRGREQVYETWNPTPYTGWVHERYTCGQPRELIHYKNGRRHGQYARWHENGQKEEEGYYEEGNRVESRKIWYISGQIKEEWSYYSDGLLKSFTSWQKNGKKQKESHFKDGKVSITYWYGNGQKKSEATYSYESDNYVKGERHRIVTAWYEGGHSKWVEHHHKTNFLIRAKSWKPDGGQCPETNITDGNGLMVTYYENGNRERAANYEDGCQHGLTTLWDQNGNATHRESWEHGKPEPPQAETEPVISRKQGESREEFNERSREKVIEEMRKRGMAIEWKPKKGK